jgi:hypothetical protein
MAVADCTVTLILSARDTIVVPDSLKETDPLKYRYYIAIKDSTTRVQLRDSLINAGDTLQLHLLDSLYLKDSTDVAKAKYDKWYASLSRQERKRHDAELALPGLIAEQNRKLARKDSIKAVKDSIIAATPRILSTFAVPDSMHYKRIITWDHDRYFHNVKLKDFDTTYNYHFHDYPFFKGDAVNSVWLGVVGSPEESYDYFKRADDDNAIFLNLLRKQINRLYAITRADQTIVEYRTIRFAMTGGKICGRMLLGEAPMDHRGGDFLTIVCGDDTLTIEDKERGHIEDNIVLATRKNDRRGVNGIEFHSIAILISRVVVGLVVPFVLVALYKFRMCKNVYSLNRYEVIARGELVGGLPYQIVDHIALERVRAVTEQDGHLTRIRYLFEVGVGSTANGVAVGLLGVEIPSELVCQAVDYHIQHHSKEDKGGDQPHAEASTLFRLAKEACF